MTNSSSLARRVLRTGSSMPEVRWKGVPGDGLEVPIIKFSERSYAHSKLIDPRWQKNMRVARR